VGLGRGQGPHAQHGLCDFGVEATKLPFGLVACALLQGADSNIIPCLADYLNTTSLLLLLLLPLPLLHPAAC
jgi:hypothetical protein